MAVQTDTHIGDEELLYVSLTEPADPEDPDDYELVGLQTQWDETSSAPSVDTRTKLTATQLFGANTVTYAFGFAASLLTDPGQQAFKTAHRTQPKPTLWWLLTTGVTGQQGRYGKGKVGSMNRPSTNGATVSYSGTFANDGNATEFIQS